jgi:hypothetical protein
MYAPEPSTARIGRQHLSLAHAFEIAVKLLLEQQPVEGFGGPLVLWLWRKSPQGWPAGCLQIAQQMALDRPSRRLWARRSKSGDGTA